MQTIANALSTSKQSFAVDALDPHATDRDMERSRRLQVRLTAQFGGKMADLFAGVDPAEVQAEWAEGLDGFHDAEVLRGLAACRGRVFPPTLGEFLRMCRPALDPEWAWNEAGEGLRQRDAGQVGNWSHPAVFRAACTMSPEVRSGDYRQHRTRWQFTMERELAAGWGEPVPPAPPRLKHQPKLGPPPQAVRQRMAGILAAARGGEVS